MNRRFVIAVVMVAGLALAIALAAAFVTWADLSGEERAQAAPLMTPARVGVLVLFAIAMVAAIATALWGLLGSMLGPAARLAAGARLVATANPEHRLTPEGAPELRAAAEGVNALAEARSALLADMQGQVAAARAELESERTRLAALMSELAQAVVVCNREGRILLYNAAAQALFAAQSEEATGAIGLGRSVFGLLDRNVVVHAVDELERRAARSVGETAQFVTTTAQGGLLRVHAAPVARAGGALDGYVLLLADVTADVEADARRVALFQGLTEATRAALANIRAAIENLVEFPDMEAARRTRFAGIIRDEAVKLSQRLDGVTQELSEQLKVQWPLEEVRGEDLVTVARRRIEARLGLPTKIESLDETLWVRADTFSLAQGLSYLAGRLQDEFEVREVRFRLQPAGRHVHLDLLWRGAPLSGETAFTWENDPFKLGGEESPLTLKAVVERHGGESWYQRDLPSQSAYFRFVLPVAGTPQRTRALKGPESRPEFYDFDLFRTSAAYSALDDRPLAELAYTVFDTETTGLSPNEGDEIIAIGAVRIVNGRLLSGETFETLVDPARALSPESIAIHGITPDVLQGQPRITQVLPRFHRFTEETVLVGHNAAFDMRFLQMKEQVVGLKFDQPVLDTLLLSQVLHPDEETHRLEAIAARFGVDVVGRHTALGDALVTGEIFLRMLPMLHEAGIRTLGQARKASQETLYAKVAY
jgi:DNA polymerase-3 subunit epsilon